MTARSISGREIEIMIVEDSRLQTALLRHALTLQGYVVVVAQNGDEALRMIRQRKPTLVISDIVMPKIDGYELCSAIKHDEALKDIPVILLTQLSEPEDIIKGLNAGADNYVIKPEDQEYEDLLARVGDLISNLERRKNESRQPKDESESGQGDLEIFLAGKTYTINSDRRQILDLLISIYDQAIRQNHDLLLMASDLQASEERYRRLLENTFSGFYRANSDGKLVEVNPAYVRILGYDDKEELLSLDILSTLYTSLADYEAFREKLTSDGAVENHVAHLHKKDGTEIVIEENVSVVRDWENKVLYFEGFVNDITDRVRLEKLVRHRALHDPLTELPNRVLFTSRLMHALTFAQRNKQMLAVAFLDLDGFKQVNDRLGHNVGDQLLKGVANRLKACLRQSDTVARLGSDEFTMLLAEITQPREVDMIAEKILQSLNRPWKIDGSECRTTISMGIALYPTDGEDAATLLKNADTAMHHVKAHGKNSYLPYATYVKQMLGKTK
jgi:diguanylate cyclase (GGDEF)-like protein/PAS domain S-box-containing protein